MINDNTHTGPSFSLTNRLARVIWGLVYWTLFRFSPKPFHFWRAFLLRLFGASVEKHVHVYPGVKIWAPWHLTLKEGCGIASGADLYSQARITIGEWAVISQGVYLCTGTHDYTKAGFPLNAFPISIGNQVWLAADVFVHPGVTVGDGTVVGARSVVHKSLPPWKVCVGVPCKVMKDRVIEDKVKVI